MVIDGDKYLKFLVNGWIDRLVVDAGAFAECFHRLISFSLEDEPSCRFGHQPPSHDDNSNRCRCNDGEETPIRQGVSDPRKASGAQRQEDGQRNVAHYRPLLRADVLHHWK